jgi:3-deoxy-manno-octulosonate cytidylyltransferase (CMP-KDO synthetase)
VDVTEQYIKETPFYRHIGLYGYRAATLAAICALPQSFLEKTEKLEQLRWIENGLKIRVAETNFETHAVDTPQDLEFINSKIDWK